MFSNKFGHYKNVECGLVRLIEVPPDEDDYETRPPKNVPIPLRSVAIVASVVHAVAQVELTQVYVNKEHHPIEAIYYFPVDSNGGVTHFHAELEGRTITSVVKPEDEAKAQYEKAVEQKQTAFLVESNKPDIFKVRVGFLKPGSQVKIVIGYVTEVKNEKGSNAIRFFIPTTVAPRYIGPNENDAKAVDLRKMKFSESTLAQLTLTVNVAIQGKVKSMESPTHQIEIKRFYPVPTKQNWNRAVVTLKGHVTDMDRDFVLLISPEDVHVPRLYSEKVESSTALMTHLIPSFNLDGQKVELLFVLDRSGSMQGSSINLAKKALTLFLHSLPVDCYFNIIGFGSTFEFFFPKSVKYSDGSLRTAISHSQKLDANLGGTEILEPLKAIYAKDPIPGYFRQIFILTDGEVSNTDQVIGICQANAHNSRVFALGIGDSASHHLVEGLAKAGGGTSVFATCNESIDSNVLHLLQNAVQPALKNVKIKWTGIPDALPVVINKMKTLLGYGKPIPSPSDTEPEKLYWEVPQEIGPIFDGAQLVVFGVFPGKIPSGVEIIADSPDGPLSIHIELSEGNKIGAGGMIHKLAGIKAIQELELKVAGLTADGKEVSHIGPLKAEIIRIALQNGLASKYTSFVAVDTGNDGKVENNWIMQTRYVPSQIAHGWHGGSGFTEAVVVDQTHESHSHAYKSCGARRLRSGSLSMDTDNKIEISRRCKGRASSSQPRPDVLRQESMFLERWSPTVEVHYDRCEPEIECDYEETSYGYLHALVATQSFNGSFLLNQEFSDAIGKPLDVLLKVAQKNGWNKEAWATALALTYLREKLSDLEDSFVLVENKGRKWLRKNFGRQMESMLTAAREIYEWD